MRPQLLWRVRQTCNFFGIGQGPSKGETSAANALTGTGAAATGMGLSDLSQATNFWDQIMTGNLTDISKLLGPEFSAIQGQGQQAIDTAGQFGNRSGGTNAQIQGVTNNVRGAETSLIDQLTAAAPTALASIGSSTLSTGVGAEEAAFGAQTTLHDQSAAQWNDIFNSIGQLIAAVPTMGASLANMKKSSTTDAANLDATSSGGYGAGNVANNDVALPPLNIPGTAGYDPTIWGGGTA